MIGLKERTKKQMKRNKNGKVLISLFFLLALLAFSPSALALSITSVEVLRTTSSSITINWQTDTLSTGRIRYGPTTTLGFSALDIDQKTNHTLTITQGISADTQYFFEIFAENSNGNEVTNDNLGQKFTARTKDISPPPKTVGLRVRSLTPTSIALEWASSTAEDATHYLIYENRILLSNTSLTFFNHTGLSDRQYSYKVSAVDSSGNEGSQSDTLIASPPKLDSVAPIISGFDFENVSDDSLVLVWKTDEPSTSELRYGQTAQTITEKDDSLRLDHSFALFNVDNKTEYSYTLLSCDESLNCANLSGTFKGGRDLSPPSINVTIPRHLNRRSLDLSGTTEPFSEVRLYVNNLNIPSRVLGSADTGESGKVQFRSIILKDENILKLEVIDRAGNINTLLSEVSVDTYEPIVAFKEVPSVTSQKNLTLFGTTNEPVTIKAYVRSSGDTQGPLSNITGFSNGSVGKNFAQLKWNDVKDPDFSHYILRRGDIGPIAIANPARYTSYTDILVDAGRTYSYTLSYMNTFGTESAEFGPVTITIPSEGSTSGIKPVPVDIRAEFRKPAREIELNSSGEFSFSFDLGRSDDSHIVKIDITDRAGNLVSKTYSIQVDTKVPDIKVTSPPTNALLFENYADSIPIKGKTEPGARVHLYVSRTPFNSDNLTFDIAGLKNGLSELLETDLDADCKAIIRTKNLCSTNADYSTTADSNGEFSFDSVDLTSMFAASGSIKEVDETEFSQNTNIKQTKKAKIVLIATDKANLRNAIQQEITIGNCWSGNVSWDMIPLNEYQSPTFLSTERLSENTESIYFYFNYSYMGNGRIPKIKSVSMTKACGTFEVLDPRFNISCQILPSGAQTIKVNPEGTLSYSAIKLNRIKGMDRWLEGDWKSFFGAVSNELTFPFKVTITYEHEVEGKKVTEVQTTCQEVTYAMDNSRIDPRRVLPDWLLYDFVDLLNQSLSTIEVVQRQLDAIMPYVATTCLLSYGSNFGTQVYRRWLEIFTEKQFQVKQITDAIFDTAFAGQKDETKEYCKGLINLFKSSSEYGRTFKLSYLSDSDMKKCFPQIAAAWETEATSYKVYRYSCDRLFGHATPAQWTYDKSDKEIEDKLYVSNLCGSDQSVKGQSLRKEKCSTLAKSYSSLGQNVFTEDDYCLEMVIPSATSASSSIYGSMFSGQRAFGLTKGLFKIDPEPIDPKQNLYRAVGAVGISMNQEIYVIKTNENNYLTARTKSCAEVCGSTQSRTTKTVYKQDTSGKVVTIKPTKQSGKQKDGFCAVAQDCTELNQNVKQVSSTGSGGSIKYEGGTPGKEFVITQARREGFTSDCFYDKNEPDLSDASVVGDDPTSRVECCCVIGNEGERIDYYDIGDTYRNKDIAAYSKEPVHKSSAAATGTPTSAPLENSKHTPLEWSYRYWKTKFPTNDKSGTYKHTAYNPFRYVEGRDFPACFGQNDWLSSQDLVMLDSNRQHLAAVQCVNLGGVQSRLTLVHNIISSLQTCLIQVRTTGRADSGVCKELFTQYVCSFTWDAIQAVQNGFGGCNPQYLGIEFDKSVTNPDSIIDTAKGGLKAITQTLGDKQQEFLGEYQNAKLNEMIGGGQEAIARKMCLFAFGYDWEINVKGLIDASYAQPFATLVQAVTASREYLTVEPTKSEATYEYRGSWVINPGCDFSGYKVELACIGRDSLERSGNTLNDGIVSRVVSNGADCTKQGSPDGINCPCLDSGEKTLELFSEPKKLKQNQLVDKDTHKVITSRYKYDHLKVTLRADTKIDQKIRSRCFPTGYDKGVFYFPIADRTAHDISACRVDVGSGALVCNEGSDFFSSKGFATLTNIRVNGVAFDELKEVYVGDSLRLDAEVFKTGKDKCLRVQSSRPVAIEKVYPIQVDGTFFFNDVIIDQLRLVGNQPIIQVPGITAIHQSGVVLNRNEIPINVYFEDTNVNKQLDSGDLVKIENHDIRIGGEATTTPDGTVINAQSSTNIRIEKAQVAIVITNVNFNQLQGEQTTSEKRIRSGTIRISPATTTTSETQQLMEMVVSVHNLKDTAERFTSFSDCNLNTPAVNSQGDQQSKTIRVNVRNSPNGGVAPQASTFVITPEGGNHKVSARISGSTLTNIQNVYVNIISTPAGEPTDFNFDPAVVAPFTLTPTGNTQNGASELSGVIPSSTFSFAGTYTAKLNTLFSTSTQTNSNLQAAGTIPQTFQVPCAPNSFCTPTAGAGCSGSSQVLTPSKPCISTEMCCAR